MRAGKINEAKDCVEWGVTEKLYLSYEGVKNCNKRLSQENI